MFVNKLSKKKVKITIKMTFNLGLKFYSLLNRPLDMPKNGIISLFSFIFYFTNRTSIIVMVSAILMRLHYWHIFPKKKKKKKHRLCFILLYQNSEYSDSQIDSSKHNEESW